MLKKLIAPLIIVIAVVVVFFLIKQKPRPETKAVEDKQSITLLVNKTNLESHPLLIPAEGFVSSRWQTTLSSQVSGRVIEISDELLVGNEFKQGDVLLKVDPLDYQVQVSRAQANVRSSESNLVEQQMQSKRAASDWKKLNPNREPSDFNLRLPQLNSAASNAQAAKEELKLAQENLKRTEIKAPFDGFSVARSIDLGEQLTIGGAVAEIVDRKNLELKISLTTSQANVIKQADQVKFMLTSKQNDTDSKAEEIEVKSIRFEPFIDSVNRFRSLVLELDEETEQPLVGEFLSLSIQVNQNNQLLKIPESSLSIDGRIWYVYNGTAQFFVPSIAYQNEGHLYLNKNSALSYPIDVVVSPPNSLLKGTAVKAEQQQTNSNSE